VREHERLASGQIRFDVFLVALAACVGQRDHDDVGLFHGFGGGETLNPFPSRREWICCFIKAMMTQGRCL